MKIKQQPETFEKMRQSLQHFNFINDKDWQLFSKDLKSKSFKKGDLFVKEGQQYFNLPFRKLAEGKIEVEFILSVPVVSACRTIEGIPNAALKNNGDFLHFFGINKKITIDFRLFTIFFTIGQCTDI